MRNRFAVICLSLVVLSCTGSSDDPAAAGSTEQRPFTEQELSDVVAATREEFGLPGLGVLVKMGDKEPVIAVSGVRKLGSKDQVSKSDLWFIGSTAKPMTAMLLATFVNDGSITFETTLLDLFPEYSSHFTDASRQITVAHILSHAAGLPPNPANTPADLAKLLGNTQNLAEQRKLILRSAISGELLFAPGSDYAYSNTGYILAAAVIERVGKKPFETLLVERIFAPLGITHFGFGHPGTKNADGGTNQPWGHRPTLFRLKPVAPDDPEHVNPPLFNSAGNLYITLADWSSFVRDQLRGRKGQGVLLEPALYKRLQMPSSGETGYALGWGVLVEAGVPVMLTHNGGDGNWYADVRAYPPTDLILLVVTNDGRDEDEAKKAAASIRRNFNSRYAPAP